MSCLSVILSRIGGPFSSSAARGAGGIATAVSRVGGIASTAVRDGWCAMAMPRIGKSTFRMGLVCGTGLGDEDVLWATDGRVFNVYGDKIYITRKNG